MASQRSNHDLQYAQVASIASLHESLSRTVYFFEDTQLFLYYRSILILDPSNSLGLSGLALLFSQTIRKDLASIFFAKKGLAQNNHVPFPTKRKLAQGLPNPIQTLLKAPPTEHEATEAASPLLRSRGWPRKTFSPPLSPIHSTCVASVSEKKTMIEAAAAAATFFSSIPPSFSCC